MLYNSKHESATVLDLVRHLTHYHFLIDSQRDICEAESKIYNKSNLALYEKKDNTFVEVEYAIFVQSDEDKQKVAHNVNVMCDFFDDKLTNEEFENKLQHIERKETELQKCELELIELVRNIDISTYVNSFTDSDEDFCKTDYNKMYDEDTTEVMYKAFIIAIAQYIQEKLNMTFEDALLTCTKIDIYNKYMQADTVEEIVDYSIQYKII
jgi:hypothetical protein